MKKNKYLLVVSLIVITLLSTACSQNNVSIEHIHGLGYSEDGNQLIIPAHNGLISFSKGKWSSVDSPKHDYMGFVMVDTGFYSSGHPAAGTNLKNPLGIIKSTDRGKTLSNLDLEGISDFHAMAVGYKTHAIYVNNEQPNPRMKTPGLYYTKDEAKTWMKSEMNGYGGETLSLATHPTDDKMIAIGAKDGLFLSKDSGNHFEKLLPEQKLVTSLFFNVKGDLLIYAASASTLLQIDVTTKDKKEYKLPTLEKNDAISYITQNPKNSGEIALTTFSKDVFVSEDFGTNWTKIADKGRGK
jgi:hypothetical protein